MVVISSTLTGDGAAQSKRIPLTQLARGQRAVIDSESLTTLAEADGESLTRFAALHESYNPWALAWLESLLKSADARASAASEGNEEL